VRKFDYSSGMIPLQELIDYANEDQQGRGLWTRNKEGRKFSSFVSRILQPFNLSKQSGIYVWIKVNMSGNDQKIYVGQSHDLGERLRKELSSERVAFWPLYTIEKWDKEGKEHYPNTWPRYRGQWKRAQAKEGATHIVWVASNNLAHIRLELIEARLIDKYKKCINIHRAGGAMLGDEAEGFIQQCTEAIIQSIKTEISGISPGHAKGDILNR